MDRYEDRQITEPTGVHALSEPGHQFHASADRGRDLELALDDVEALGPDYEVPTCQGTYCATGYNA